MAETSHSGRMAHLHEPTFNFWLQFDPTTAAIYEAETGPKRARQLCSAIILGLGFYNLYNLTSVYLIPDILWLSVWLRAGVITPISLTLAYAVLRVPAVWRELLVLKGMIGALAAPVFLFWLTEAPLGHISFGELDLTLVFGCLVIMLRFRDAAIFVAVGLVIMVTAILTKPGMTGDLQTVFILQSVTAAVFCLVSNFLVEWRRCGAYVDTLQARYRAAVAEEEADHLQVLSQTDPLTGLANRRALDAKLDAAFAQGGACAIFMLDLDFFKQFNDTLGHPAGDVCLEDVGQAFAEFADQTGVFAARFGGEEFTFVVPDRSLAEVHALALSVVEHVSALAIAHPARPDGVAHVTVSLGVGMRQTGSDKSIAQVMNEADAAIYLAKKRGRNQAAIDHALSPDLMKA